MIRTAKSAAAIGLFVVLAIAGSVWVFWTRGHARPLGPVDGHDLSAIDTGRVRVGDVAPDFRLVAFSGDTVALSDFRGKENVVLVFYRGHW